MGFRNPITSASAVDTTGGSGGGVRIFNQPVTVLGVPGKQGVIEFDDGIAGDVPPNITVTPGGNRSDQGGQFVAGGGSFGGLPVPTLTLAQQLMNMSNDSGMGGVADLYAPDVIALDAPHIYMNGNLYQRPRGWSWNRVSGNASDQLTNGAYTTLVSGTVLGAPAGDWRFGFRSVISNTVVTAGFTVITVNSAAIGDGNPRADCVVANARTPFFEEWTYTHGGGDLTVRGQYQPATGTGTASVWTQGTQLTATYLGPRT